MAPSPSPQPSPQPPDAARSPESTILVVDDEVGIREAYQYYLSPPTRPQAITSHRLARRDSSPSGGVARVLVAATGEEAVELVRQEIAAGRRIQAGFFDMKMPGGIDGVETIRRVLALDPDLLCVVVTAYTDQPLDEIRALFGASRQDDWDYLNKPFNANEVIQKARNAVATWSRRRKEAEEAAALAQANSGLEAQIAERTQSLIDANAELGRSYAAMAQVLADLQASNDRLRVEMAERARLESERRLASKLEGIGQLAAGIAHEINTPTQYILSNAEMLKEVVAELLPEVASMVDACAHHGPDPSRRARAERLGAELPVLGGELTDAIGSVLHGARAIARIVGAMREFSRADAPDMRPADLNHALQTTLDVVRSEYRQVAEIELELGELPAVNCHVGEIQQVMANLIVNAAHAIESRAHKSTGRIRIASRHDPDHDRVVISVADNGVGIAPEHRDRVFDPFFTTKPVGRGTGQGLTIARNVVSRHRGDLAFESDVGVGTRFELSLPVSTAQVDSR